MHEPIPIACNLNAISPADRTRYRRLVSRLRAALSDRSEIEQGYVFHLRSDGITSSEIADWIALEHLCCPFLTLRLSTSDTNLGQSLTMTGPLGIKQLIQSEFPPP